MIAINEVGLYVTSSAKPALVRLESSSSTVVALALIILIVVFGALVAAGIPLLLALTAVLATFGLWAIPSHVWPSDESLYAMVLLIGLAVGVDYSMFYLKREREERATGRSGRAALEAAAFPPLSSLLAPGRESGAIRLYACSASTRLLGLDPAAVQVRVDALAGWPTFARLIGEAERVVTF